MTAYLLQLPTHLKADAFERFARDRWLPALAGNAASDDVRLLRRTGEEATDMSDFDRTFLLLADRSDGSIDPARTSDAGVNGLFSAFDVAITCLGRFAAIDWTPG